MRKGWKEWDQGPSTALMGWMISFNGWPSSPGCFYLPDDLFKQLWMRLPCAKFWAIFCRDRPAELIRSAPKRGNCELSRLWPIVACGDGPEERIPSTATHGHKVRESRTLQHWTSCCICAQSVRTKSLLLEQNRDHSFRDSQSDPDHCSRTDVPGLQDNYVQMHSNIACYSLHILEGNFIYTTILQQKDKQRFWREKFEIHGIWLSPPKGKEEQFWRMEWNPVNQCSQSNYWASY